MSEEPSAFIQHERKARKEHQCCECKKTIEKGETYVVSSGIWDGTPDRFKQCSLCAMIFEQCAWYAPRNGLEPVSFHELRWWLSELYAEIEGDIYNELQVKPDELKHLLPKTGND